MASRRHALRELAWLFLRLGTTAFVGPAAHIAMMEDEVLGRRRWLTRQQFLDYVVSLNLIPGPNSTVGQVTPGPVFTTATFIGYLLGGVPGAAVATLGIFLPAFFFVAISGPLIPRIRHSVLAGAALDGLNVASLALMAVVTWHLGRVAILDVPTTIVAGVSFVLLVHSRLNSAWLVAGGAMIGWLARGGG